MITAAAPAAGNLTPARGASEVTCTARCKVPCAAKFPACCASEVPVGAEVRSTEPKKHSLSSGQILNLLFQDGETACRHINTLPYMKRPAIHRFGMAMISDFKFHIEKSGAGAQTNRSSISAYRPRPQGGGAQGEVDVSLYI